MSDLPYSTITVSGTDAFDFLQAQLAADLRHINTPRGDMDQEDRATSADPMLSAWCNPKGRVICLFRVVKTGDDYRLIVPTELVDAVVKRLIMFRFRAKVAFAVADASADELGIDGSYADWRLENLRGGIAEILGTQSEQFTPHMLNLDLLNAVSVEKGCYPGQEIVARTHFRGATKRRLLRFGSASPTSVGDKVAADDRVVGEVLNAIGTDLLAVVATDKADTALSIGDNALLNLPLPYL